jgi:hypothetical protein
LNLETLKHSFMIGRHAHKWLAAFDWLYALRDPAVHPEHKTGPAVARPSGWGNFAAEYANYSANNAEKAPALLDEVLEVCVANPRTESREWAEGAAKAALAQLRA